MHGWVGIVNAVGPVHAGKHRLQCIVLGLVDRIEFMVVTAGALDRDAGESLHHGRDHVVAVEVAANLPVDRVLADVPQRTFIPRPGGNEAERYRRLRIVREEHVACDLFLHELRVGLVGVEGGDEVITIWPGVGADAILVVAVRFCEVNCVHPMPRPALAVTRCREQAVHDTLVCLRRLIREKRVNLLRRWRQADEIEINPAEQGAFVRSRRRLQPAVSELRVNESVDGVA